MNRQTGTSDRGDCFTCQGRQRSEWCVLGEEELALLNRAKISREYVPGEPLFREGDPCSGVYCIESGLVGIRRLDAGGSSLLVRLAYPGDTVGYRAVLADENHRAAAEAVQGGSVCFIDRATVRALLERNPALGLRFLGRATRELDAAEERALLGATMTLRARFAHLLLVFKDRFATSAGDGAFTLELPLSRQDLAAMVGARPESMSRAIRSLEDDGVARFSGRTVHVPRLDTLLDEIDLGEDS
jgi:CRP/FNR family transcriptional regulator